MSADPVRIAQIAQVNLSTLSEDAAIKNISAAARDVEISSVLYNSVNADAENIRQFNLMKISRNIYQLPVRGMTGQLSVGQTITLKYPRFGLDGGKDFMITGLSEQFGRDLTTLTLWG